MSLQNNELTIVHGTFGCGKDEVAKLVINFLEFRQIVFEFIISVEMNGGDRIRTRIKDAANQYFKKKGIDKEFNDLDEHFRDFLREKHCLIVLHNLTRNCYEEESNCELVNSLLEIRGVALLITSV